MATRVPVVRVAADGTVYAHPEHVVLVDDIARSKQLHQATPGQEET